MKDKIIFMLRLSVIFGTILFFAISCTPEEERPALSEESLGETVTLPDTPITPRDGMALSGIYALDDGSYLTRRYISFSKGAFYDYRLKEDRVEVVLAGGFLWHCDISDFEIVFTGDFEINEGNLICAGITYGSITISNTAVYLDGVKFSQFEGLKSDSIIISSPEGQEWKEVSCVKQVISLPISLDQSFPPSLLQSKTSKAWLRPGKFTDGNLLVEVDDNPIAGLQRNGKITVSYPGSESTIGFFVSQSGCERDNSAANSYVVSTPGTYMIKAVKGCSTIPAGSVSSVDVLWESFGTSIVPSKGDIIQSVSYNSGQIIYTTANPLKDGNAVIAAKDADGNILWSWHIWVCEGYDPVATAQEYYNNAGVMMDRNLGATSATPGDVGALGLLYQWGRKDPFLGNNSISSNTRAESTITWPGTVSSNSSNGTSAYAVAHPTTFITAGSSSNYDWVYSSRDNTLWQSSKTIYDPCPPGWRVPDGGRDGVWSKAVGSSSSFSKSWNSITHGMNFSGQFGSAGTIWYPASGWLLSGDGSLDYVGSGGSWLSCSPGGDDAYSLYLNYYGNVDPSNSYGYRAYGFSVRCQKE